MAFEPVYRYRASVVRVKDGDTLILDVDLGFKVSIQVVARVAGVNCPELSTREGQFAKQATEGFVSIGEMIVESYKNRQSYDRWVMDVYVDGASLADHLVSLGAGTSVPKHLQM